ncbi:two-component system sensor histidine kinase PilS (NtrC family) [Actimicrobium sp. GrIS 1.19]|uniref:two-component system sensor histidine kinase NtrB n=1 Tax=Actimicrobium sp. GrIS 1.19 TaxID=3071708 RepID=UPI002DFA6F82|nr:two-component system sensor histidine kinase PilS (NtrC family) [Actimicrobium sp. GrIS 1.19]
MSRQSVAASITLTGAPRDTLWRTLQTFNITRIVIALLLLVYLTLSRSLGGDSAHYMQLCVVYLMAATAFALLGAFSRERFLLQLATQIIVDIVIISSLYVLAGSGRGSLAILFLFPLAGGAILAPLVLSLFFTSLVALVLLSDSLLQSLQQVADVQISTAGLYGMAFFFATLLLNRLASKLIKQEALAARRGAALDLQQAINRLVIADMGDGILVVDRDAVVVTCNPAAETLLGLPAALDRSSFRLADVSSLAPIADAFTRWIDRNGDGRGEPMAVSTDHFVMIKPGDDAAAHDANTVWGGGRRDLGAHLKLRFAPVEVAGSDESRTVIFMQDVSEIDNKAQQLKLASMGRLTASIAHEVRNPLSAISYASSLLEEDMPSPTQVRLLRIIEENVSRLNQMIEDILKLSRKAQPHGPPLALAPFFDDVLAEFIATRSLPPHMIAIGDIGAHEVSFDPLHLREVVVNLLSNATRYASGGDGSIRLEVVVLATGRIELHVQDDGTPITPAVRAHLFEPFYTTSSKGTGLGLYLARELCLNNGALLDYEYRADGDAGSEPRGRFVISFAALPTN